MKMIRTTLGALTTLFFLSACMEQGDEILPGGTGNTGDLVVVMDSADWSGASGRAIMECFAETQAGLPQPEPSFNVVQVRTENFKQIFKTTKNIVLIETSRRHEKPKYSLKENAWAKNQLVLTLLAPDGESAASIISKNCENLRDKYNQEEYRRLQSAYAKLKDAAICDEVQRATGVSLTIPNDYRMASTGEHYAWLRKDFDKRGHQVSMGLIVYSKPYQAEDQLTADSLVAVRNAWVKMVEGPQAESHMKTFEEFTPVIRDINWKGKFVRELRGLWNMENAFMGGPFVHFSFLDKEGHQLICVDGYVFAPKFDKREFLRELEAIALSGVH